MHSTRRKLLAVDLALAENNDKLKLLEVFEKLTALEIELFEKAFKSKDLERANLYFEVARIVKDLEELL